MSSEDKDTNDQGSSSSKQDNDLTGYIQNIHDVSPRSFSFDLQMQMQSKRFLCFSPSKRKNVEDHLLSPVKVKNARKGNTGHYFFNEDSDFQQTELDFAPINYKSITVGQLQKIASQSIIDITVQFIEKQNRKNVGGKAVDTFNVGDPTGTIKFTIWNECAGRVDIGGVYALKGVRVQHDQYGQSSLVTPKEGFSMTKSDQVMECSKIAPHLQAITGEIMSIECISKYHVCDKCHKKLPPTDDIVVYCQNEKCNNFIKLKFAGKGGYVRFNFMTKDERKLILTMFLDEIECLVKDAWNKTDLKEQLVKLSEIVLTKNNKDIVSSIRLA